MQYKGLFESLDPRVSANDIDSKNSKFTAFSLGEMLMVLLIMSFIAIGIPGIHFKKSELKTKRSLHGRYECYYACPLITDDGELVHNSGCAANEYKLYQYSVNEEGAATGPEQVTTCVFTPPHNAVFFLVHAVGGGGGAYNTTGSVTTNTIPETGYYYTQNDFPKWLRDVHGANALEDVSKPYSTSINGTKAQIRYGKSGKAGETMSLLFPRLRDVEIVMKPGKGGELGHAGEATTVTFNTVSNQTEVINVKGGAAGSGTGVTTIWIDGPNTMCAIKNNDDVGYRAADFAGNVELDKGSKMKSKMEEVEFGSGGSGAYGNVLSEAYATYYVNGKDVSEFVQREECVNPTKCGDGSENSGTCAPQPGRNGAVMILW